MQSNIHDAAESLARLQKDFEDNVQDSFGKSIVMDFFNPCMSNVKMLEEAIDTADREGKAITEMINQARAIL